ncbi:MAG: phasin family protein [Rhodoferax sp.]|uniref:phasin family protein n=1 Tax=Rhodoferax sp. TaxID=50421 RepID=UPI00184E34FC|nr:phasin family protein [Rhodoferax sp.]NMM20405.1 phasin family protein [Rhodoferax sp.]
MVKKLRKINPSKEADAPLTGSVKDSAQQIWQAGLGAFNKAQAEGSKAFEALVKEGVSLQRKTQSAAEEKISEATSKMSSMANDISSKASGQWDKLESIFEDRVAKVLNKLGVPSAMDVNALIARIDELNKSVKKLSAKEAAPKAAAKVAAKAPVKKAAKTAVKPALKTVPKTAPAPAKKPAVKRAPARKTATVTLEATPD